MSFDAEHISPPGARIKVLGVGGGGGNAVNTMIRSGIEGVEFVTANTDVQALRFALAPHKIQVGKELTKGLGAGADPDIGRDAALEDRHEILEMVSDSDMVFVTAGMGGGTGTGGAGVVAQIAREAGALTVGVVTKPFDFEGKRRKRHAEAGINRLRENVDTLIIIPNQRLLQVASPDLTMIDAFKLADDVLVNAVRGISDIINVPGTVNVDFADVKTVMSCMGQALMGIGVAEGEGRATEAATQAIASPLLEDVDIEGATGLLINITAGENISLMEVNEACSVVQDAAHEDANIIFGAVIDEAMKDSIRVTVIATGFPTEMEDSDSSNPETVRGKLGAQNTSASVLSSRSVMIESSFQRSGSPSFSSGLKESSQSSGSAHREEKPVAREVLGSISSKPITPKHPTAEALGSTTQALAPSVPAETLEAEKPAPAGENLSLESPAPESPNSAVDEVAKTEDGPEDLAAEPSVELGDQETVETLVLESTPRSSGVSDHQGSEQTSHDTSHETEEASSHEKDLVLSASPEVLTTEEVGKPAFEPDPFGEPKDPSKQRYIDSLLLGNEPTSEPERLEGASATEEAPLDTLFDSQSSSIVDDIDRTIDRAIELANRAENEKEQEDDLEIPAFLRHGVKDVPLD